MAKKNTILKIPQEAGKGKKISKAEIAYQKSTPKNKRFYS